MEELIRQYVEDHKNSWAESTRRSEYNRLHALVELLSLEPERLWDQLAEKLSPYSRVTAWVRISNFYDWLIEQGHRAGTNPFRVFRKRNARLFKHCYERKLPTIGFEEALRRVETIEDGTIRQACLLLLRAGLRSCELATLVDGTVVGKGGRRRRVFNAEQSPGYVSFFRLRKELAARGLKPHMLRKIAATEFRRRGLREEDLLKVMGWDSMETAKSYLAPLTDEEIAKKLTA